MNAFRAFSKKEWMETVRTGRLWILLILFTIFGVMNPAIAKLTPWLMDTMSESLKEAGMTVADVTVDAMTSWAQFYKNLPIALIVFLILYGGILTGEREKLIPLVTRGLGRGTVLAAKALVTVAMWSVCYWLCFGITWGYNAYFWDNGVARHLFLASACPYLLGLWLIAVLFLLSAVLKSNTGVLIGVGGVSLAAYLLGMLPKLGKYLPMRLMATSDLLTGAAEPETVYGAILVTAALTAVCFAASAALFQRRNL